MIKKMIQSVTLIFVLIATGYAPSPYAAEGVAAGQEADPRFNYGRFCVQRLPLNRGPDGTSSVNSTGFRCDYANAPAVYVGPYQILMIGNTNSTDLSARIDYIDPCYAAAGPGTTGVTIRFYGENSKGIPLFEHRLFDLSAGKPASFNPSLMSLKLGESLARLSREVTISVDGGFGRYYPYEAKCPQG